MSRVPSVGIVMGSDSDLPVMQEAAKLLEEFDIPYELTIVSAHRTPERLYRYAREAAQRGLHVIIAGAGGAAHLPGMMAAITEIPVIGVPVKSKNLAGLDSLYSIVQMPPGVPVAAVAINGAKNAGLLAVQILGVKDAVCKEKMRLYKNTLRESVEAKAADLEKKGYVEYLARLHASQVGSEKD